MRAIIAGVVVGVLVLGCTCARCRGESSPLNNDLVINATEAAEWIGATYDVLNVDVAGAVQILFLIATGNAIPSGTQTVTINNAQLNRWFNTTNSGSWINRIYWHTADNGIKTRRAPRALVASEAIRQATDNISNTTKRARWLSRLDYLMNGAD